jgi:hypothetical protein
LTRHAQMSVVTDWRTRDEDLHDLAPDDEIERRITPQKFCVLLQITTVGVRLVSLRIGNIHEIPFRIVSEDGPRRAYAPTGLSDPDLKQKIAATGAAVAISAIAVPPAMDVVRNEGPTPVKPRVALLVQEEI